MDRTTQCIGPGPGRRCLILGMGTLTAVLAATSQLTLAHGHDCAVNPY